MAFDLQSTLKALLFSTSQPLSIKDIQNVFARYSELSAAKNVAESATESASEGEPAEVEADEIPPEDEGVPGLITAAQIREAMEALAAAIVATDDVYRLVEGAQGYRLTIVPRFARWVRVLRAEPPPVKLTASALETLAVIAYRQPVTRSEIEAIRGVSADAGLNKLLERELIYVVGRADLPGRPLQYGTTDQFLEFVGVKTLVELPASDVLSPRQIDSWLEEAMNPHTPGDEEMGLPLEDGQAIVARQGDGDGFDDDPEQLEAEHK